MIKPDGMENLLVLMLANEVMGRIRREAEPVSVDAESVMVVVDVAPLVEGGGPDEEPARVVVPSGSEVLDGRLADVDGDAGVVVDPIVDWLVVMAIARLITLLLIDGSNAVEVSSVAGRMIAVLSEFGMDWIA
jgi:hypothetical protein